ncbi:NAD(P)/FAD-dependent oxidoreductase [Streptomyces smyrnaeus]|uniref:NAD(P)/FAD-dependent oxidoreductase n=1 Tax=Streptomyces TaxID=1883 RepID=UPI000C17B1DE|nr:FAD-binding oxidoreductase [Streptomyces sp. B15]MBQ1120517.1 FAD-binding oxidoreductase [Streptomyces sp. B15]MBQ1162923.1 FAD-binding oxidoreductase [Streptomyces sp. A73]
MNGTRAVVLGAGIIGAACARELALAGLEVTVLDRGGAGAATTSHGEGNVLVSDKGPGPELRLAQLSRRLWPEVLATIAERSPAGARCVEAAEWDPKGGIVVATTEAGAHGLAEFAATQRTADVRADTLTTDALRAAEPCITHGHTAAVHYPEDAQVQPAAAAAALLTDALAAGARLRTGEEVLAGVVARGDRLTGVRTPGGVVEADLFVNAAGPWSGALGARLGAPVAVEPRRGDVLVTTPLPPTVFHKVYDADYVGAVGSSEEELQTSAVVESTRAGSVLIGSSRRRVGFDDRLRPEVLSAVAAKALRLFPSLAGVPVMRAYGGFRPYVPDHLPVVGADPRLAGLWHASGHEGAGIGLSVGTGRLLRDLVLGEPTEIDAHPFRVDRPAVLTPPPASRQQNRQQGRRQRRKQDRKWELEQDRKLEQDQEQEGA